MSNSIRTRMGDGELVFMSAAEVREDISSGTEDAARKGNVAPLSETEQETLFHILAEPSRTVSVAPGNEVVVTDDGCSMAFYGGQDSSGVGVSLSRQQAVLLYERACAADTTSMGHSDYSYKPVKPIISYETADYHHTSMHTTAPFLYGAQPNMGLYFQPDGPFPNPADLLPQGKIADAQKVQEEASAHMRRDVVFCARKLDAVGCEGLNLDTCGSAGDADFLAALQAVEDSRAQAPGMPVIMGGAGEFVLGMHGEVTFAGKRLAGMYPHDQVKVAEAAGVSIYGVAIGTVTSESLAWNAARAVTLVRAAVEAADIPVHVNVGMGVGGIPMVEVPPIDSVTRVSKSLVEIGKADGL
jgi:dimethylamine--corrinoid protein Co-methyltransferase